jgi:hypothetical protein
MRQVFDCRPGFIIQALDLLKPIYRQTAAYGHFGRSEKEFTWEHTDKVEALIDAAHSGNGVAKSTPAVKSAPPVKKVAAKTARA